MFRCKSLKCPPGRNVSPGIFAQAEMPPRAFLPRLKSPFLGKNAPLHKFTDFLLQLILIKKSCAACPCVTKDTDFLRNVWNWQNKLSWGFSLKFAVGNDKGFAVGNDLCEFSLNDREIAGSPPCNCILFQPVICGLILGRFAEFWLHSGRVTIILCYLRSFHESIWFILEKLQNKH